MKIFIEIDQPDTNAVIRWGFQTNQDEPVLIKYQEPVKVRKTSKMLAVANLNGKNSFFEEAEFVMIPRGRTAKIKHPYSSQYTAGGDKALINTLRGGDNFTTGNWQGYRGENLEATIDIGKEQFISKIGAGFLQDQNSWIFMPEWVRFEVSPDGVNFTEVGTVQNPIDEKADGGITNDFEIDFRKQKVKFIRVTAKNPEQCPAWHKGFPEACWLFTDEVWWE